MKPKFISMYQGEADYEVLGRRVRVRSSAENYAHSPYSPGTYEREILPMVGCVAYDDSRYSHEFPTPEIMEYFPGYVAAKYEHDTYRVIHQRPPEVMQAPAPYQKQTWCKAQYDEMVKYGIIVPEPEPEGVLA